MKNFVSLLSENGTKTGITYTANGKAIKMNNGGCEHRNFQQIIHKCICVTDKKLRR